MVVTVASSFLVADAMAAVSTYDSKDVPKSIPDPGETVSSLTVPDSMIITDVDVVINITHAHDSDLSVYLVAPDGTQVELFTGVGVYGQNFTNTTLDDEATTPIESVLPQWAPFSGRYQPEGKLSTFDGLSATGMWQLKVKDGASVCKGTLNAWSLIITGEAPPPPPPPGGPVSIVIDIRIAASTDDSEEHVMESGKIESPITSSDLELGYEGGTSLQTVACRWVGVSIPKGATITKAWVQFSADDIDNSYHAPDVSVVVEGELSPNPVTFSLTAYDISSRTTTTAKVVWDIPRWMTVHAKGPEEQTPDISSVIQEIVNQDGWAAGNAIVLMFRDNPAKPSLGCREAESWDGAGTNVDQIPLLHVEFAEAVAPPPPPPPPPPVEPTPPPVVPTPVTITVEPGGDIAAANAIAQAGDTIAISAGTYYLTSQIAIKSGVTYRGAGPGLTIIDGNNVTRAFVAWGDRFFNEDTGNPNNSGPKDWVLEGMTIQNCVADANDRFSYTSAAFNLKTNFATRDTNASGGLDPNEANTQVDGIRLPGADGTEGTADDDLHRFAHIDTNSSGEISLAELDAQLLLREDEFGDQGGDGGAITIANEAVGTIQNCDFLNNHTPAEGDGDDGGAVNITGLSVVTINDCLFNGNYACSPNSVAIAGADGDGGHIKVQGSSASAITPGTTLTANRCIFLNGNASDDGGAIEVSSTGNVVRLDSCKFEGNTSWDNGNVLRFGSTTQNGATITNCIFVKNITKADNSPDRLIEATRNTKVINCTFVGNHQFDEDIIYNNADNADTNGDGVNDETTDTTQVINCLFANNTFGADATGDHIVSSRNADFFKIKAVNCLFFNNLEPDGKLMDITNRTHTGSVQADPLLDANYVPGAGSPAINAGVDPATIGVTLTTDYNGAPRPQGAAYDIGAFEAP